MRNMKTESKILLNDSIIKPRKKVFGENYERHCNKDLRKAIKAIYVYIYIYIYISNIILQVLFYLLRIKPVLKCCKVPK